jgi:hypothetical protein
MKAQSIDWCGLKMDSILLQLQMIAGPFQTPHLASDITFPGLFFFMFVEFICFDVAFYDSYAFVICSAAIEAMVLCGYEGSMFCVETPSYIHFVYCGQDIIVAILIHKLRWAKSIVVLFSRSWLCDRILVSMV